MTINNRNPDFKDELLSGDMFLLGALESYSRRTLNQPNDKFMWDQLELSWTEAEQFNAKEPPKEMSNEKKTLYTQWCNFKNKWSEKITFQGSFFNQGGSSFSSTSKCKNYLFLNKFIVTNEETAKGKVKSKTSFTRDEIRPGANLSFRDLSRAHLREAHLREANLMRAHLREANLMRAHLREANLMRAHLREANLSGADLSGADLSGANLSRADLSGANLSGANLSGANLSSTILSRANLSGANLSGVDLREANLSGANLSGVDFTEAYFGLYQILATKNWETARFSEGIMEQLKKMKAKLPPSYFPTKHSEQ